MNDTSGVDRANATARAAEAAEATEPSDPSDAITVTTNGVPLAAGSGMFMGIAATRWADRPLSVMLATNSSYTRGGWTANENFCGCAKRTPVRHEASRPVAAKRSRPGLMWIP